MMQQPEMQKKDFYDDAYANAASQASTSVETPDILIKDYQFLQLIGEGANGKTWLAISRRNQKKVAVKALKLVDTFKSLELFKREANTLLNLNVEGVPKFFEFIESDKAMDECYLVQEFFDYPSIQSLIDENNANHVKFSEAETLHIMHEIAQILYALQTQYSPPVIHRDIKPSNILYDRLKRKAMLIDFGAVAAPSKKTGGSTVAGTQGFMAPEQMLGECTIQSDFYGLGATALYMLTGVSPVNMSYDKANPFLLNFDEIFKGVKLSSKMKDFLKSLLSPQVENRPANASELLECIQKVAHKGAANKKGDLTEADRRGQTKSVLSRHKNNKFDKFISSLRIANGIFVFGAIVYSFPVFMKFGISGILIILCIIIILNVLILTIYGIYYVFSKLCSTLSRLSRLNKNLWQERRLPCANGYQSNKIVIEKCLMDEYVYCVYYCPRNERYRIYAYADAKKQNTDQKSLSCKLPRLKSLGCELSSINLNASSVGLNASSVGENFVIIDNVRHKLVDGTKQFQHKA